MDNTMISQLQLNCQSDFKESFTENKFLYFDKVLELNLGITKKLKSSNESFNWIGSPNTELGKREGLVNFSGVEVLCFIQECKVTCDLIFGNIVVAKFEKNLTFTSYSHLESKKTVDVMITTQEKTLIENINDFNDEIRKKVKLNNIIGDYELKSKFSNTLLKERQTFNRFDYNNWYPFYYEFESCHFEIQQCVLNALLYYPFTKRYDIRDEIYKKHFLSPWNLNNDMYLMNIGFAFDRLYAFWDRITIFLFQFEKASFSENNISFDKYIKKLKEFNSQVFNQSSTNLKFLINFNEKEYKEEITEIRHRIVHFQFYKDAAKKPTSHWQGLLTSKFNANKDKFVNNEKEIIKLQKEFDGYLEILIRHSNLCKEGLIKALDLIDEIN
jgi:hypothetical protein